ncbi:MAG TPA: lanthionine synthetase LanC family protein, partial [Candidatus Krumholzibacteria bacterium]|nr:lanthionine synthetase LanC family protein [Candidatus Krumholzibacteria bacterium]
VSRLRAYELLREESLRLEATIGLDTTRRIVEDMLASPGAALSLCHGLAGNCAVLLYGADVLGGDSSRIRELALEACARVLPVGGARDPWLAGAELGDNPSVMLGRAGIGWLLLHVAGKNLANAILPHRL